MDTDRMERHIKEQQIDAHDLWKSSMKDLCDRGMMIDCTRYYDQVNKSKGNPADDIDRKILEKFDGLTPKLSTDSISDSLRQYSQVARAVADVGIMLFTRGKAAFDWNNTKHRLQK